MPIEPNPTQDLTPTLSALAAEIGHDFAQPELLRQALTHPSSAQDAGDSYERLEFLGDRVLGLVVADLLLARFPNEPEGSLSRRLGALVRRESLAEVARADQLGRYLILAKPERQAGEDDNPALLADACEALIGALFLDGGLAAARGFIEPRWRPRLEADLRPPQDAKTALQEWAQGRGLALPFYREVARSGPHHEPHFTIEVTIEGEPPSSGEGRSKRQAEQRAASRLLERIKTR